MPTKEQASQYALMIHGGMPPVDALAYFFPDSGPEELSSIAHDWSRSPTVQRRILELQGKTFQDMTLDEKIKLSLELHYSQMAYFLYSRNYSLLSGTDKQKADTCRLALESKIAGTAGQTNPLISWWDDVRRGKVTLGSGQTASGGQAVRPTAHPSES